MAILEATNLDVINTSIADLFMTISRTLWMNTWCVIIQMTAIKQYLHMKLFVYIIAVKNYWTFSPFYTWPPQGVKQLKIANYVVIWD